MEGAVEEGLEQGLQALAAFFSLAPAEGERAGVRGSAANVQAHFHDRAFTPHPGPLPSEGRGKSGGAFVMRS